MWKYPFALVVTAGVITSSVYLYRHRDGLFRPDVRKLGGTLIAFSVAEGDPDEAFLARMQRRFDPKGSLGVVVRQTDNGEVEFLVPKGSDHDDLVDRVKRLAARRGWITFRTIASSEEDDAVTKHVVAEFALDKSKKRPIAAPPPPPANPLGNRDFTTSQPGDPPRRYRWDRLNEAVLPTLGLDPTSLGGRNAAEKPIVEQALATGSVFSPIAMTGSHVLCTRLPGVTAPVFFVLTREDDASLAITSDNIRQADVTKDGPITTMIRLRLDREGLNRMRIQTERRLYGAPGRAMPAHWRGINSFFAVLVDDEIVTMPQFFGAGSQDVQLIRCTSDDEAEDLACLMRASVKGVQLNPRPTRVEVLEPRR